MRKIFRNIIMFVLCMQALPLVAQTQTLSIDSCRTLALQHNKERQSAALLIQQMEYTRRSTRAMFFPDLSLSGIALYGSADGTLSLDFNPVLTKLIGSHATHLQQLSQMAAAHGIQLPNGVTLPSYDVKYKLGMAYAGGLSLKQPLYMGGKIRAGYAMSKSAVDIARQNQRLTDAEVIQKADEAYAQVIKAQELALVAQSYKTLLLELDKNVESAIRHGMRMPNDRMKVQVRLNEVELQLRRATNGIRLAKMNLCHIIGCPLTTDVEVENKYPEVDDAMLLQGTDIASRPELAMLDGKVDVATQEMKMARSALLPQVALLARYGYTYGGELQDRTLLHDWGLTAGVSVSVPLYHFGERTNKVKAARVKQQIAQLEREDKSEMMMLELSQCANKLDEARLEVTLAEKSLQEADMSMKLARQQYDAGMETLSDYLESQAIWQKAYQAQTDARFQLYLASVAYLKATGRLVE